MIVDTHTHLYLEEFGTEKDETVDRAISAGVGKMIFPNVDLSTIAPMKELAARYPGHISMAMGLHPTEVNGSWEEALAQVKAEFDSADARYVAVGEIGIDLYWDKTFREEQMKAFSAQIDWAIAGGLPVIIHCRDGLAEVLEVLDSKAQKPEAVFHSFGGTVEDVRRIRQTGDFYFGINGIVTFKNSRLADVLPEIGLDRILFETDAPYLAPVPYRGKRNESAYIVKTAEKIAEKLSVPFETVCEKTTENALRLFREI